jgi:hypothetical protein
MIAGIASTIFTICVALLSLAALVMAGLIHVRFRNGSPLARLNDKR